MKLIPIFSNDLEQESESTRKFLALVTAEKCDWKPHEKSMSIKELSVHIAEIPGWIESALTTDGINFADGYEPTPIENTQQLQELQEKSVQKSEAALDNADEEDLLPDGTIRNGDQVLQA